MIKISKFFVERFFSREEIDNWLTNLILVKFLNKDELIQEANLRKRIHKMRQYSVLNGMGVNCLDMNSERDSYLSPDVRN